MPKKIPPLTDAKCRAAKFDPDGGNKLFDGAGLFLEVVATGAKRWRFRYKQVTGKESTMTLGEYPAFTLAEAREKRGELRKLVAEGIDPVAHRQARKVAQADAAINTVEAVTLEWVETRESGWSDQHISRVRGAFARDVFPSLGSRPIADVTGAEILKMLRKIEARGSMTMSHKTLEFVSNVWRYAIGTSRVQHDVTRGLRDLLKAPPPVTHHPHVTEAELPELLSLVDGYSGTPETILAIKLMVLTFLRTNEMRWARWSEIDLQHKVWRVPSERMKGSLTAKASGIPHLVPLARQTIALLEDLRALTGQYALLFPGVRNPKHQAMSAETINKALKSLGFEGRQTGHGFRGLASTLMNEKSGFQFDAIERQLAHAESDKVRAAYNHAKYMGERLALMQWWADFIDQKSGRNTLSVVRTA